MRQEILMESSTQNRIPIEIDEYMNNTQLSLQNYADRHMTEIPKNIESNEKYKE
jgi:hypothetical protein